MVVEDAATCGRIRILVVDGCGTYNACCVGVCLGKASAEVIEAIAAAVISVDGINHVKEREG